MNVKQPIRRCWDPVVKITHWSMAVAVLVNAVITEEGSGSHVWVGYGLAAILSLRLLWGMIGPAEARFGAFWPSPRKAVAHLRHIRNGQPSQHSSHNPLGAFMVYAIWGCLLTIIATGISMAGAPPIVGSKDDDTHHNANVLVQSDEYSRQLDGGEEAEEGLLGEVHETAANLLYLLILLHLAGVLFETRRSGSQVLMAMLPLRR